jgi:hypothetical protein
MDRGWLLTLGKLQSTRPKVIIPDQKLKKIMLDKLDELATIPQHTFHIVVKGCYLCPPMVEQVCQEESGVSTQVAFYSSDDNVVEVTLLMEGAGVIPGCDSIFYRVSRVKKWVDEKWSRSGQRRVLVVNAY